MSDTTGKGSSAVIEQTAKERRENLRFPFTASVEVTESKSGARITARTSDLGLGGCYVDSMNPFPVGTDAKVRITRGNESFEAEAKIIYSQVGVGMGIAFVSAQQKHVRLFQRWLIEISGSAPSLSDVSEPKRKESSDDSLSEEKNYVLNELLITLMRKGVLAEKEGKAMLKKLLG